MKKSISLIMTAIMSVTMFASCGGASTSGTDESADASGGDDVLEISIAHNQTSPENPYSKAALVFEETLEDISDGQIQVTVYNGTLGEDESELVEKLSMGAVDMIVASPGFMTSIGVNEVDMLSLPYLFDSYESWEAALDGEFGDAMKDVITEKTSNQFKVMGYWSSGVRSFYGKVPVYSPDDVKGLTIRTQSSPVQQQFWKDCGAIPTSVAWNELYQALQQGVVDAAENDYTSMVLKDHHKTKNGHNFCETEHDYTTRLLLMNGDKYDALTDEQKGWIDEACEVATDAERDVVREMADESKAQLIEDGGNVVEHDDIDIDAFREIAIPIQDEFAQENDMQEYLDMIRSVQ